MSSFWSSSTSEFRFLGTKLTIDSYSLILQLRPPRARNLLWAKFRVVAALIRTGKQTLKKSYCASEPRGEKYKTSGMYWRVLDDEEAAAY